MRIAVAYEDDGTIFQHFGHTKQFKLYDVQEGGVISSVVVDVKGSGHGALAGFLTQHKANTLICGGIGSGAKNALDNANIALYGGVLGGADQAVADFLAGSLAYDPNVACSHHGEGHEHEEGHACGGHCHGSGEE